MSVRRALVAGDAALAGLGIGQFIHDRGAVLLAVAVGLAAWWLGGRYLANPSQTTARPPVQLHFPVCLLGKRPAK
jgi:hypothetical protein